MPFPVPLLSDRVLLRPFEEADAAAAHRVYGDAEVMRYVGAGGAVSRETTSEMITDYRRHEAEHGFAFWAVLDRGSGELIGDAGLEVTDHGTELGYTLARRWWGRGLATEAAQLCIEAAFGPLELPRLVSLADVENPASARVLEKLGFLHRGLTTVFGRPHHCFALSPDSAPAAGPSPGARL
ncbi:GNAT family N-acetyltransferase [Brachybacterium vulturis]|uniref:GNAT family N-acetyltransferase n=1 Tax=Brachybacterium vulturis TaxID=2017484 RepID=UPI0037361AB7